MKRQNTPSASPKKELGFWMCTSLVTGNMIGAGIFMLPVALAAYGGISILGWLYTACGTVILALVFARLSQLIPKAGGPYAFTQVGYGDFAGFLVAWGYWISIWIGNAAIAVAGIGYLGVFFPILTSTPIFSGLATLVIIWILTWVNTQGIRQAGYVQLVTTILKLIPLVIIGIFGFFFFKIAHFKPFNLSNLSSFSAITATAAITLWAFMGLESASIPSDHVFNPQKTIPRSTILGTLITAFVYMSSTIAVMGIISPENLAQSTAPFADAADVMLGSWGRYVIAVGAAISCFGALNGWILLQGQIPRAAALDNVLPQVFARLSKKGTPVFGIIISSVLVTLLIATNYSKGLVEVFTFAILLSTLTTLVPYCFCSLTEIILYFRDRSKFNKSRFIRGAILSVLAFLYSLWAVAGLGQKTVYWGFLLLIIGIPVYVLAK